MASLPNDLALTTIADEGDIDAAPLRNDFSAVQTAFNALNDLLGGGTAGQILGSGGPSAVNWVGSYASYTPTWTSSGSAPAFGNATVTAHYVQFGHLVHALGQIIFGSTTTFGTGNYSFSLPVAPGIGVVIGTAFLNDVSASAFGQGLIRVSTFGPPATMDVRFGATYLGTQTLMGQTTPWTWASGDIFEWNITYESA